MNRQLYMGGGIMNAVPREKALFGGIKKAVKKVTKGVKDIVSSDLGKAALLAATAYYAPGIGIKAQGGLGALGTALKKKAAGMVPEFLSGKTGLAALGIGAGALFGGAMAGKSEEEVEALTRDVPALKSYLTQYYTNLNPELRQSPEKVEQFVNSQIAEYNQGRGGYAMGGRMQYGDGTMSPEEYFSGKEKYMKQKQMEDMIREYERYIRDQSMNRDEVAMGGRINYSEGTGEISINKIEMLIKRGADNDLIKEYTGAADGVIDQIRDAMERKNKAVGGKMDTASENAMQAAGIEGLPIRQNPKGVKELDLRDNGGFIPPVGIKEKEDDIPAMLSNNEFVFTADAVRGMGDGDVELGAQRMYDQMKMLEKGGRV